MLCSSAADSRSAVAAWLPSIVGFTAVRVLAKVFSFLRASCTEGVCNDVYRYLRRYSSLEYITAWLWFGLHAQTSPPGARTPPYALNADGLRHRTGLHPPDVGGVFRNRAVARKRSGVPDIQDGFPGPFLRVSI